MPDIKIAARDGGNFTGYLAKPTSGRGPGVLVIQEIFGVNQGMREITDGFAKQGFVALCPDLFWRQEPGVQITDQTDAEWKRAIGLMNGFNLDKGIDDLKSALDALRKTEGCSGKVGTVGYCLGGKLAYLMATRSSADCNVSYYGVGIDGLLGEAGKISKPLMMHVAEADQFVPPEAQNKIKDGLAGNKHVTIHSYPGADHGFARVGGKHWSAAAAQSANQRTAAFYKQHLG